MDFNTTVKDGKKVRAKPPLKNLISAAIDRHTLRAERLLERGDDPNQKDEYGRTPLWFAAGYGPYSPKKIAQLLVDYGANLNIEDINGQTPLFNAVKNYDEDKVKLLLDHGANPNHKDKNDQTPLFHLTTCALSNIYAPNNINKYKLLLNHGADPNLADKEGTTPLKNLLVSPRCYEKFIELLLEKGASPNEIDIYGRTALQNAALDNNEKLVRLLLQYGANPLKPQILQRITNQSIVELCRDTRDWTPLHWAVDRDDMDTCVSLIQNGANPNKEAGKNEFKCSPLDLVKKKLERPFYGLFDTAPKTKEALMWYPEDVRKASTARALLLNGEREHPLINQDDKQILCTDVWRHVFSFLAPPEGGKKDGQIKENVRYL